MRRPSLVVVEGNLVFLPTCGRREKKQVLNTNPHQGNVIWQREKVHQIEDWKGENGESIFA